MKVLLVYPECPVTFWSFKYALRFVNKRSNLPPLGILTVAAMLPKEWELKLIDLNVEALKDKDILWSDMVFISAMNIQSQSARQVIDRCKRLDKKTVAGGPLFTMETKKYDDVDHLLLYEGESCIPQFLSDLEKGELKHIYAEQSFPELDHTPIPRWDLLKRNKYAMLSLQYSRGCPFNCEFCNIVSLFGRSPRTKSTEQFLSELNAIYDIGWRGGVFFVDDNFIGNKVKLKQEVLPAMIAWMKERSYPFTFFTEVSINLSDDEELMDLMAEAGFDNVFIGIETVDEECLNECAKQQNQKRDLLECVKTIQQHGMQVQGGFILGFDNEKTSIFKQMSSFIQNSGIITAMVGILSAPTGTRLYERMKKEKRLVSEFSGVNTEAATNIITVMDRDTLMHGYNTVLNTIYSPANYYRRVATFLENYRPRNYHKEKLTLAEIWAFIKANFLLGIVSSGRLQYWKLLNWTRKERPELFSRAVAFSIYGYHFWKCVPKEEPV